MKNKALVLLTAIYLFSTLGVSAQSMYCMGVLRTTKISYVSATTPKAASCKMAERMKRCCKTKKQLLKIKDQHFYQGTLYMLAKLFPVLFNFTQTNAPVCTVLSAQQTPYNSNAPPNSLKTPAYMMNCNYRI